MLAILRATGTLSTLFRFTEKSTLAAQVIDALDEKVIEALLRRTMDSGETLGPLPNCIARVSMKDPRLASLLNRQIGSRGYASFVKSAGTVTQLVALCSTLPMDVARDLIEAFDTADMDHLLRATVKGARSIGTIAMRFRRLRVKDRALADKVEQVLTAERYAALVVELGTIVELIRIFDSASPTMARGVLDALGPGATGRLVARTLASDRPIGTLHFGLSALREIPGDALESIEKAIGAQGYRKLISEQGTIAGLFGILSVSSDQFAGEVIESLTETDLDAITQRTAEERRGVGAFAMQLRALKAKESSLACAAEKKLSGRRYVQLLSSIGTIPNLTTVLGVASLPFASEILDALDPRWTPKTGH